MDLKRAPQGRQKHTVMANTFVQNIMHITFHTGKDCTIGPTDITRLCDYIGGIVKNLGGTLIAAGGIWSHLHLLVTVPKTISLSDYVMKIKANSSRWLKTLGSQYRAFSWQDGYGAFSVSATKIKVVREYIANQAEHHRSKSYIEEVEGFIKAYQTELQVSPLRANQQMTETLTR